MSEYDSPMVVLLHEELSQCLKKFVFEPNDGFTRLKIRETMSEFLHGLKEQDRLADFYVRCDDLNNPQTIVDRCEMRVDITFREPEDRIETTMLLKIEAPASSILAVDVDLELDLVPLPSAGGFSGTSGGTYAPGSLTKNGNPIVAPTAQPNSWSAQNIPAIQSFDMFTVSTISPAPTGKLPKLSFVDKDEHGARIELTLEPEPTISGSEALKLVMMVEANRNSVQTFSGFSPYLYVKEQGLERHFKISR